MMQTALTITAHSTRHAVGRPQRRATAECSIPRSFHGIRSSILLTRRRVRPLVRSLDPVVIHRLAPSPPLRLICTVPDLSSPPGPATGSGVAASDWQSLMARARMGDHRAYEMLLREVAGILRPMVRRALSNPSDVEDVIQDILVTVHQVSATYDPARPFAPWLITIARRRVADWLRRNGKRRSHETGYDQDTHEIADARHEGHLDQDDLAPLMAAIRALPDGQRQAVELLKLQELSLKEASAKTGLSISALKVATHRAFKSLRTLLERTET